MEAQEDLAQLLTAEQGKPLFEARGEMTELPFEGIKIPNAELAVTLRIIMPRLIGFVIPSRAISLVV